ncbi:MAG: FAD-dependent oxidoreductase [Chloroflexi bacterium]|nr:FAD-dependent oxidoreductase [Chloroflexota bacterium]
MLVRSGVSWDKTSDVVIIGYGIGGAVSAITAAESGAEAIILEKQSPETKHNNTSMSGGIYITPPDVQSGLEYMTALCRVAGMPNMLWTDRAIIRAWAEYAATGRQWVEERGGSIFPNPGVGEHPQLPGGAMLSKHRFRGMGIGLARFLDDQVKAKKVSVLYETRAVRLLTNLRGRVVGVEAETTQNGQTRRLRIRASRAVVLAPGGFEYDEETKLNYLRVYPTYFTGSAALTGDGIRMALDVGAQLWHMNCVSARLVMKFPGIANAFTPDHLGKAALGKGPGKGDEAIPVTSGYIIVDGDGRRYTSENIAGHALYYELALFDTHRLVYPRVPSYIIFDRRRLENGPLPLVTSGPAGQTGIYRWSADNGKEVERGWIKTADTVRGLARKVGISAEALERTVKTFNRYCEKGKDPDFSRKTKELIPLESAPYCAVDLWPGGPNTQGGPRRNSRGQILNADGKPIPGLYGCGELGSVYGMLYPGGGGNITEGFAFGRIVGENAAREKGVS